MSVRGETATARAGCFVSLYFTMSVCPTRAPPLSVTNFRAGGSAGTGGSWGPLDPPRLPHWIDSQGPLSKSGQLASQKEAPPGTQIGTRSNCHGQSAAGSMMLRMGAWPWRLLRPGNIAAQARLVSMLTFANNQGCPMTDYPGATSIRQSIKLVFPLLGLSPGTLRWPARETSTNEVARASLFFIPYSHSKRPHGCSQPNVHPSKRPES